LNCGGDNIASRRGASLHCDNGDATHRYNITYELTAYQVMAAVMYRTLTSGGKVELRHIG
jgi:hypothetical protein